jgi:signal transduction histidine kinase
MAIERICFVASQFLEEGNISARCEYRRGELTISMEDTGEGLDAETLPHIFDRFIRNKKQELVGTGLDLPIVQSLIQQMGGTIDIESELGKGTAVWLSVPCEAQMVNRRVSKKNEL